MLLDPIPPPVRIGFLIAVIVGALVAGWTVRGWLAERDIDSIEAGIEKKRAESFKAGRDIERKQQEVVNHVLRTQNDALVANAAGLQRDIDRLRQRASRADKPGRVSEAAPTACPCGSGAELCREDAEFLVREAARADDLRAGLEACYQVIDGLHSP